MKKLFSVLAMLVLTLSCGALLTACDFGDPPPSSPITFSTYRWVNEPDENLFVDLLGAEVDEQGNYKIQNGIQVHLRISIRTDGYEFPEDFWFKINGSPVYLSSDNAAVRPVKEATFPVNGDATMEIGSLVEKQTRLIFAAQPTVTTAQSYPDNIFLSFEDYEALGLSKAEYTMEEYKELLTTTSVEGVFGAASGTVVYSYTKNFEAVVEADLFDRPHEGDQGQVWVKKEAYYDDTDRANIKYGYKNTISSLDRDANVTISAQTNGLIDLETKFYGGITQEVELSDPIKHVVVNPDYITDVNPRNPLYDLKIYNGSFTSTELATSFGAGNKLKVEIDLLKYDDPEWRTFYDRMEIAVYDTKIDFQIDNGKISFDLDLPYTYLSEQHRVFSPYEIPDPENPKKNKSVLTGFNMFTYHIYTNLIAMVKEAGMLDRQCIYVRRDNGGQPAIEESGIELYFNGVKSHKPYPFILDQELTVGQHRRVDADYGEEYYRLTADYTDNLYLKDTKILYSVHDADDSANIIDRLDDNYNEYRDYSKIAVTIGGQRKIYDMNVCYYDELINTDLGTESVIVGKSVFTGVKQNGTTVKTGAEYFIMFSSGTTIEKIELLYD